MNRSTYTERTIMNQLFDTALRVGLRMSGINQEVAPAQWEYQIGPVPGIQAADQMIFAKYILYGLCEQYGLYATFHPKPLSGDWNGSGCHVNISTRDTRKEGGLEYILCALDKFGADHTTFLERYCGNNNHMRLTGEHETSDPRVFNHSVGGRSTSVRIPYSTRNDGKGYFEDRRPGSSIDYYATLARYLQYL